MMPNLSEDEANDLAREFDFTGGEIENVVRKAKVKYILMGEKSDFEAIRSICHSETVNSGKNKVGF